MSRTVDAIAAWWEAQGGVRRARWRAWGVVSAFAFGLALGRAWAEVGPWIWLSLAAATVAMWAIWRSETAVLTQRIVCACLIGAAAVLVGAGWYAARLGTASPTRLDAVLARSGVTGDARVEIEGVLRTDPRQEEQAAGEVRGVARFLRPPDARRMVVAVEQVIAVDGVGVEATGKVWARVEGVGPLVVGGEALRAGDRVRLLGMFSAVQGPENPGGSDLREYARQEGFVGFVRAGDASMVSRGAPPQGLIERGGRALRRATAGLEVRARAVIEHASGARAIRADAPEEERSRVATTRALLLGLVLGDYDPLDTRVRDAFARQGLSHILSISGFHLAVMAGLTLTLLRLTGDRGWVEPLLVGLVVAAYMTMVPANAPVVRSGAMVLGLLLAEAMGRRYDRVAVLAWIWAGLLIWRPLDLWSLGTQLSVGLTAVLMGMSTGFHVRMGRWWRLGRVLESGGEVAGGGWGSGRGGWLARAASAAGRWLGRAVGLSISTSVLCWVISAAWVMGRIGVVSVAGVAATVALTPLFILMLWVAYVMLLAGVFAPGLAGVSAGVLGLLARGAVAGVEWLDSVDGTALFVPPTPMWWVAGATIVAALWGAGALRGAKAWAAWLAVAVALGGVWFVGGRLARDTVLRVDMLSVGDGTAHLIRSGGDALVWDLGSLRSGGMMPEVVQAARSLKAWPVRTAVVTHPDIDHYGGLARALRPLGVRRILVGQRFIDEAEREPWGMAADLLREALARGVAVVRVAAGEQFELGEATVRFVNPPRDAAWSGDNDHSLAAVIEVATDGGVRRVLMTGDVQAEAIGALSGGAAGWGMVLDADVLELPHHGSAIPTSIAWVDSMRGGRGPAVVLQSTGPRRVGDARWAGVVQKVRAGGGAWWVTARDGAAWVEIGRDGGIKTGAMRAGESSRGDPGT